ncbi:MAG TPA: porin [Methylosinus sp.]
MKLTLLTSVAAAALLANAAFAADLASKKPALVPAPPPDWFDTLTIDGFVEGGIVANFANPVTGINFGHLFTDRPQPTLNQAILTFQRPLDPKATDEIDFGFKVQWMYGTDARYSHYLGVLDYAIWDRAQIALIEAHGLVHLPILTAGGVDVKFGQFVTYNGFEVIPAKDNLLYTHSYIFNFGPFMHTGVMTTTHATEWLDILAGVTTGVNTSIGWPGDNNNAAAFHGGFMMKFFDETLMINAITHAGPETPKQLDPLGVGWPNTPAACACDPNSTWRYYNNLTITWKATEDLTLAMDSAYFHDDGWNPNIFGQAQGVDAYGVAGYASYKINDMFTLNGRAEYFRDNNNFFVAAFPGYFEAVNALHGFPAYTLLAPSPTSYLELTLGMTITPPFPETPIMKGIIFRPEFRWDTSLTGNAPFDGGRKRTSGLFAMDVIIPFALR